MGQAHMVFHNVVVVCAPGVGGFGNLGAHIMAATVSAEHPCASARLLHSFRKFIALGVPAIATLQPPVFISKPRDWGVYNFCGGA